MVVPNAQAVQKVAHRAARGEHHVAALVEPAHVMSERALAQAADAPPDYLRQVRMIEGDERNATTLRHAPGAPRRVKGITHFDEVRLERIKQRRQRRVLSGSR